MFSISRNIGGDPFVRVCRAQMVQGGFMSIWERLGKKLPNVHTQVNIQSMDRRQDSKKPILIK